MPQKLNEFIILIKKSYLTVISGFDRRFHISGTADNRYTVRK